MHNNGYLNDERVQNSFYPVQEGYYPSGGAYGVPIPQNSSHLFIAQPTSVSPPVPAAPPPPKIARPANSNLGRKICLLVFIVILVLIIIGVVVFLLVYFLAANNQPKKLTPVTCVTNSIQIDNYTCTCSNGYAGDGVNYCDECGVSYYSPNVRIVGGVEAVPYSWPASVLLTFNYKGRFYFKEFGDYYDVTYGSQCGGTLIDRKTVLTAAHCIVSKFTYRLNSYSYTITVAPTTYYSSVQAMYTVYTGIHDQNSMDATKMVQSSVNKIIVHQDYDASSSLNDIALLKLTNPVPLNNYNQITCLPNATNGTSNYPSANVVAWAAGWGRLSQSGSISNLLYNVNLTVYNSSMCSKVYPSTPKNWNAQICAGKYEGGKDTCQGDSGGSLYVQNMINGKAKYVTAGVVSYGYGCAVATYPGIYTRTSYYIPWIQKYSGASQPYSKPTQLFQLIFALILIKIIYF